MYINYTKINTVLTFLWMTALRQNVDAALWFATAPALH